MPCPHCKHCSIVQDLEPLKEIPKLKDVLLRDWEEYPKRFPVDSNPPLDEYSCHWLIKGHYTEEDTKVIVAEDPDFRPNGERCECAICRADGDCCGNWFCRAPGILRRVEADGTKVTEVRQSWCRNL